MKRIILLLILFLLSIELSAQSRIIFSIDNPLSIIVKPKYEFKDYEIPLKNISLFRGAYSGLEIIFSENELHKEFYRFKIILPFNEKFYIKKVKENNKIEFLFSTEIFPAEFTNKDFEGIYIKRLESYVYPKIILEKYSRLESNVLTLDDFLEFKSFSITFLEFKSNSEFIYLKANLKGAIYFSSDRYDAPYQVTATIEIINEKLLESFID